MKLRKSFYDNFKGVDESIVMSQVNDLTINQKELLYYIWGEDSKYRDPNSKRALELIYLIRKNLYKKNIFDEFEAPKEKVINLINTLKQRELVNLFTEYSYLDNELKSGIVSSKLRSKNLYVIKKIRKSIEGNTLTTRKSDISFSYKGFFNQFDRPKEEVLRVVYSLDEKNIDILKLKFGENFDKLNKVDNKINDDINVRICRLIRRKLAILENGVYVKITDYINLDMDTIKERLQILSTTEQTRLKEIFGNNLDKEVIVGFNTKDKLVSKEIKNKLNSGKHKSVHKNFKSLFEILSKNMYIDESMEDFKLRVLLEIDKLEKEDKDLLIKKYGNNFELTTNENNMTVGENEYITRYIICKLSWHLKPKETKVYKSIFKRVNLEERDLLLEFIDTLSNEDKLLLQKKYGLDYNESSELYSFSKEENHKIKVILKKAVIYFNRKNRSNYEGVRINSLRDMRAIIRSKKYKELLGVFNENEALAVLTYVHRNNITIEEITKVTSVNRENLYELVNKYYSLTGCILKKNI